MWQGMQIAKCVYGKKTENNSQKLIVCRTGHVATSSSIDSVDRFEKKNRSGNRRNVSQSNLSQLGRLSEHNHV